MNSTSGYILWLPSWYPNRTDPFNGDFIQRHARAVALHHDVYVLFIVRDGKGEVTKTVLDEQFQDGRLTERRIYYAVPNGPAILQKAWSQRRYNQLFKKAIRRLIREHGRPDLVHVHITWKAGPIAAWVKKNWHIPYVITEQWTCFLPEAKKTFKHLPFYVRLMCKRALSNAASVSAVSQYLQYHLKNLAPTTEVCVLPNVVDITIFQADFFQKRTEVPTFIHVSTLGYQKNPEAILHAFAFVKQQGVPFRVHFFGPRQLHLEMMVQKMALNDAIAFHGEVPQSVLAAHMRQADALILYSRYETFGCVVIEANACGLPVIASDIRPMQELVKDGGNGILVPGENATALGKKILWFIQNRNSFNTADISQSTLARYNYRTVGLRFSAWYQDVLKRKHD